MDAAFCQINGPCQEQETFLAHLSYCDQSLSVVRALSTFCFKRLLLQNGWTDFEIILQEDCLGDPLPKLLKPFRSVEQGGGRVVRWCWLSFQCQGVLLIWSRVGQGPTALAVGTGGGCLDIFSLFFLPLSGRRPNID